MNRNGQALTRERGHAKRNLHPASAQVNGGAAFPMMRSLAGEGFRVGPDLRDFSGMAVRSGGAGRFRDGASPNGISGQKTSGRAGADIVKVSSPVSLSTYSPLLRAYFSTPSSYLMAATATRSSLFANSLYHSLQCFIWSMK